MCACVRVASHGVALRPLQMHARVTLHVNDSFRTSYCTAGNLCVLEHEEILYDSAPGCVIMFPPDALYQRRELQSVTIDSVRA